MRIDDQRLVDLDTGCWPARWHTESRGKKVRAKKVLDEASSLQARRLCVTEQSMNTARPDAAPTGSRELIYGLAAALMQPFLRFCANEANFCANEANRGKASKNNVAR